MKKLIAMLMCCAVALLMGSVAYSVNEDEDENYIVERHNKLVTKAVPDTGYSKRGPSNAIYDVNNDKIVDKADLDLVFACKGDFRSDPTNPLYKAEYDFNGDKRINVTDLSIAWAHRGAVVSGVAGDAAAPAALPSQGEGPSNAIYDVNNDKIVDKADLDLVFACKGDFRSDPTNPLYKAEYDFNGDKRINVTDLSIAWAHRGAVVSGVAGDAATGNANIAESAEVDQRKSVEAQIVLQGGGTNYTVSTQMADAPKEAAQPKQ